VNPASRKKSHNSLAGDQFGEDHIAKIQQDRKVGITHQHFLRAQEDFDLEALHIDLNRFKR
jgi:hypothetical protein